MPSSGSMPQERCFLPPRGCQLGPTGVLGREAEPVAQQALPSKPKGPGKDHQATPSASQCPPLLFFFRRPLDTCLCQLLLPLSHPLSIHMQDLSGPGHFLQLCSAWPFTQAGALAPASPPGPGSDVLNSPLDALPTSLPNAAQRTTHDEGVWPGVRGGLRGENWGIKGKAGTSSHGLSTRGSRSAARL